jgi:monoamine oxidase
MNEPLGSREGEESVTPDSPAANLPSEPDVVIIGAGSAGIGAARSLLGAGLTVAVLEARDRIGGRAFTRSFRGHPVDLGAHWLHAGPINPLVKLGFARGEPMRRAPTEGHFYVRGMPGSRAQSAALDRAFAMADRAMTQGAKAGEDQAAAKALPAGMGPQGRRVFDIHSLVSGRPLDEVSLHDFPSMEYADNLFIAGGLGGYVRRLGRNLPIRSSASVHAIDWSGQGVRVESSVGTLRARAVIVTTPMAVLQAEAIRFAPALPNGVQEAIHGFKQGVYEHVILHWPDAPFKGPDRLATLTGTRRSPPGLLTRIDGTPFHFFELDQPHAAHFDRRDVHAPARFAREILAEHFGHRTIRTMSVMHATAWRNDPWSRASWAVIPPGLASIRTSLKLPVGERIWFAGEALSRAQWGTAGGAWEEGERAASEIANRLRTSR